DGIRDYKVTGVQTCALPISAGDFFVQAILNIYTEFHCADGHRVWLHMDQWEGQHFNRSPGNLYSEVQKVHLDPAAGYKIKLSLKIGRASCRERVEIEGVKGV